MTIKCIAEEVLHGVTRDNVLALVSECAEGMGYTTARLFPYGSDGASQIGLFSQRMMESAAGVGTLAPELGSVTIVTLGALPGVRVLIHCMVDWPKTGFDPGFAPCEVGAAIMRNLLRMVEGNERADAWRPLTGKMTTEASPLLQPITLNWRISELKRWVADFRSDTRADILLHHSEAAGYIDIYNEYPRPMVGMRCEHPVNGAIELMPYIIEGATPSAIAKLQSWRDALEAGMLSTTSTSMKLVAPKLPSRDSDKAKWTETWRLIQDWVAKGMNATDIEKCLSRLDGISHLPGGARTLRKIIQAGKAGHFENMS